LFVFLHPLLRGRLDVSRVVVLNAERTLVNTVDPLCGKVEVLERRLFGLKQASCMGDHHLIAALMRLGGFEHCGVVRTPEGCAWSGTVPSAWLRNILTLSTTFLFGSASVGGETVFFAENGIF